VKILLVTTGMLLILSAVLKVRTASKAGLGLPLLLLGEVVAGLALPVVSLVAPPTPEAGFRMVLAALALIVVSSVALSMRVRALARDRQASEGARLVRYVKYLSSTPGARTDEQTGPD
jgi:hypothetical protein